METIDNNNRGFLLGVKKEEKNPEKQRRYNYFQRPCAAWLPLPSPYCLWPFHWRSSYKQAQETKFAQDNFRANNSPSMGCAVHSSGGFTICSLVPCQEKPLFFRRDPMSLGLGCWASLPFSVKAQFPNQLQTLPSSPCLWCTIPHPIRILCLRLWYVRAHGCDAHRIYMQSDSKDCVSYWYCPHLCHPCVRWGTLIASGYLSFYALSCVVPPFVSLIS